MSCHIDIVSKFKMQEIIVERIIKLKFGPLYFTYESLFGGFLQSVICVNVTFLFALVDLIRIPGLQGPCVSVILSLLEPLCVIIEYVSGGSLDNLLRCSRVQTHMDDPSYANIWSRLTERELLKIAADVANGMTHLESKQVSCSSAFQIGVYLNTLYN